ncbi:MAG: ketopantoate reductase family protein [Alphaproteobacteria bacterium]|nr:ketopantoate reductase family protein [Alphaproteobacteria bacterium]
MTAFTIIGAGAVGAIVGVHLARAGHRVCFVEANRPHVEAVRAHGLRLLGATDALIRPEILLPDEVQGPLGQVLLAVKARHTLEALAPLAPMLSPDGYVVSLQNGLEEYRIAALLGAGRTIGGFLTFGGHWRAPGEVVYGGPGTFRVGEIDGTIRPRTLALRDALMAVQPVEATANIFGFLWGKLALLAIYFATALTDSDVTALYAEPRWRTLFGRLAGEVAAVAAAKGVAIEPFDGFDARVFGPDAPHDPAGAERAWAGQMRYWSRHAGNRTGIWRDLAQHRRRTEVEQLLGEVVVIADSIGCPVPRLRCLVGQIREIEDGHRGQAAHNLAELDQPT